MIVLWFLQVLVDVLVWVLGLFPTIAVPSWISSADSNVSTMIGYAQGLSPWLPFSLIFTVVAVVFSCVVAGFTIKVVRIVASFLTVGGGSAG